MIMIMNEFTTYIILILYFGLQRKRKDASGKEPEASSSSGKLPCIDFLC